MLAEPAEVETLLFESTLWLRPLTRGERLRGVIKGIAQQFLTPHTREQTLLSIKSHFLSLEIFGVSLTEENFQHLDWSGCLASEKDKRAGKPNLAV